MREINRCALAFGLVAVVVVAGCAGEPQVEEAGEDLWTQAERLAQESLIVDTHIDVPYRLEEEMADIAQATESGDFDYPRARQGGLNGCELGGAGRQGIYRGLVGRIAGVRSDEAGGFPKARRCRGSQSLRKQTPRTSSCQSRLSPGGWSRSCF